MSKDFYPYKSGIGLVEPVAIINQNVCLILSGKSQYRRVKWLEPIPPFQFLDIGNIAAQTTSLRTSAINLQMQNDEFSQIRWYTLDHVQVRLFLPNASGKAVLRNIQVPFDDSIVERDPCLHLTEMYIWENQNPWFEAVNFSDYAIGASRLVGFGYRYITDPLGDITIKAIDAGKEPCTFLTATGSGSRPV